MLNLIKPYPLNFGNAEVGSSPITVHFELCNPGTLPATWELHSNEQPEIEVEQWVEPVRPTNEQEKLIDFIVENNIFIVEPRNGELLGGQRALISMTYTPLQEGQLAAILCTATIAAAAAAAVCSDSCARDRLDKLASTNSC